MDGYRFVNGKRNVSVNSVLELVEHVQRTIMSAEVMEVEGAGLSSDARAVAIEQRRQICSPRSFASAGFWVNSRPRCRKIGS